MEKQKNQPPELEKSKNFSADSNPRKKKKNFPSKRIPSAIKQNVETVVDWTNWLESVDDVDIRRRANAAVEKLKKQIAELWKEDFVVKEGKSALKGFVKQFIIEGEGDNSISLQDLLRKARWHMIKLLQENPQTKVKCVLNVEMSQTVGEEEIIEKPFFHSRQKKNLGKNLEIIDEMEREMIENLENFNRRGSNWTFERVIRLEIHFVRWKPLRGSSSNLRGSSSTLRGSSWIALPPELEKKKALINMKNEDQMCFKWCIARACNQVAIHPERITPKLREQAEELNWDGCKFPMAVDKIKYFEAKNPQISVNVFGWNVSIFPLKNIREEKECHVDLLLLTKEFKSHYCLVKNFSRLVSSQISRKGYERFFCKRCLNSFPKMESLMKHKSICGGFETAKIEVPEGTCSFHNFQKMMHVPVVGYADLESILKPISERVKTHEHISCGYAFHLVSPFLQMEPVLKRAKDETEELSKDFIRELISCVKKAHLSLPRKEMLPLTRQEWKSFRETKICWLCRKGFGEGKLIKVRDHCHYTGKYRGAAHSSCNLKFKRPKFTPVFCHNLQNYDAHLFVRALGTLDEVLSVTCIPNNEEKYISFSLKFELKKERKEEGKEFIVKHEIRFLDSFKFTLSGLSSLVENLPKEELKETIRFFGKRSELVSQKGVYPYEFMDGFDKFEKKTTAKESRFFLQIKSGESDG